MNHAEQIFLARIDAGITQLTLARLAGVSQAAIARLENGDTSGTKGDTLAKVLDALETKVWKPEPWCW